MHLNFIMSLFYLDLHHKLIGFYSRDEKLIEIISMCYEIVK